MNLTAFGMEAIKYDFGPKRTFNVFLCPPAPKQAVSALYARAIRFILGLYNPDSFPQSFPNRNAKSFPAPYEFGANLNTVPLPPAIALMGF